MRLPTILLFAPPVILAHNGLAQSTMRELVFEDDFNRQEANESREEVGQGWTTRESFPLELETGRCTLSS